ncbi:MAG: 30S ribosomal protein S7 [Candidatus Aenigmatarchaeota archaeon]|nr:MAG: 30S ribosomal protein S7 [Candidatus Aenigmarchaeota archaeon]
MLLFGRWSTNGISVEDPGLVKYINLTPVVVPRSYGRKSGDFRKNEMNIVERFMNKLQVTGHTGKRHKLTSGRFTGNYQTIMRETERAFEIIEEKTKKNPVQILVKAIENSALYEEIAAYQLGGIIARKAVITSPQRRVDLALRLITQGIYRSAFQNKKSLGHVIADELLAIANNDPKTLPIRERNRTEKEAEGAR